MEEEPPEAGTPRPEGGDDEAVDLVTIFRGSPSEVLAVQATLRSLGFRTFIRDDNTRTIDPFILGGIAFLTELQAPSMEAERAVAALEEAESQARARGDEELEEGEGEEEDEPEEVAKPESVAGTGTEPEGEVAASTGTEAKLSAPRRGRILVELIVVMALVGVSRWIDPLAILPEAQRESRRAFWVQESWYLARHSFLLLAVLVLIHRSGLGWKAFGLGRMRFLVDLPVGFLLGWLILYLEVAFSFVMRPTLESLDWVQPAQTPSLEPSSPMEHVLWGLDWITIWLFITIAYRAYPITRLRQLGCSLVLTILTVTLLSGAVDADLGLYWIARRAFLGLLEATVFVVTGRAWILVMARAARWIIVFS